MVSFATRRAISGGGFYDYSARYGAVRDEDRVTLRQSLPSHTKLGAPTAVGDVEQMARRLELQEFLELPLVALSNGQTRRASILRELLARPELLILDEPLSTFVVLNLVLASTDHAYCRFV